MAAGRFAEYFNHSDSADVKVVIEVVSSDENVARRQLQLQGTVCETARDLCAHTVILMCHSPVWKAQLERWQDTGERKTIRLIVEEGEEAAAYRLVQCLYTDCLPDLETEVDLRLNLGVVMLADQYQVKAALSLCVQQLEMLTDLGPISWELADRVMQVPAGYLENPGISSLVEKIQEKILQHVAAEPSLPQIGLDLEVVMRKSALEEALMALPLRKCASLLSDDRCRVASENTVAAAVVRRVDCEWERSGDADGEHVQSPDLWSEIMADVIRVPHLSSLFAAAMPIFASELTTVVRPEIYVLGRELHQLPVDLREKLAKSHTIPRCWLSKRRPPSMLTALEFDWEVSAAELAEKFDLGNDILATSSTHFIAGTYWKAAFLVYPLPDSRRRTVGLMIDGEYPLHTRGLHFGATVEFKILAPHKKSPLHRQVCHTRTAGGSASRNVFNIPPMRKWNHSLMQQWTSSNGVLTVRVKINSVM